MSRYYSTTVHVLHGVTSTLTSHEVSVQRFNLEGRMDLIVVFRESARLRRRTEHAATAVPHGGVAGVRRRLR